MRRLAIVARLKPAAWEEARAIVAQGSPIDLVEDGFDRHAIYLSKHEAVFVFECGDVEWKLDDLVSDFFHPSLREAFQAWRPLLESEPTVAEEVYFWERPSLSSS